MKRYPIISKGVVKRHPIISKGIVKRDHCRGVTNRYPIISKGIVKRDHLADKGRGSPKNKTIDAKHPPPKLFFSRLKKIGPFRT